MRGKRTYFEEEAGRIRSKHELATPLDDGLTPCREEEATIFRVVDPDLGNGKNKDRGQFSRSTTPRELVREKTGALPPEDRNEDEPDGRREQRRILSSFGRERSLVGRFQGGGRASLSGRICRWLNRTTTM